MASRGEVSWLSGRSAALPDGTPVVGYGAVPPTPSRHKDLERRDLAADTAPEGGRAAFTSAGGRPRPLPAAEWLAARASIEEDLLDLPIADRPFVLVSHCPPFGTHLDRDGLSGGAHHGSRAVRAFIETRRPRVSLHGHFHDSPGISGRWWERLGDTLAIQPGQDFRCLHACSLDPEDGGERTRRLAVVDLLIRMGVLQARGQTSDAAWLDRLRAMAAATPVRMLTLIPTALCNFRCAYCHQSGESRSDARRMTVPQVDAILSKWGGYARRHPGRRDVLLYGGEPLLAPEAVRHVVRHFSRASPDDTGGEVEVVLVTNGARITGEWARFFREHDTFVIVSCDAVGKAHDQARATRGGRGTFSAVDRGCRLLKDAGVRVAVSVTVARHNSPTIEQDLLAILDRFRPLDVGLNSCLHPTYGHAANEHAQDPLEGTRRMIRAYSAARDRGVYVEQFNRRIRPFAFRLHRVKDCSACGGRMVVRPDGMASFCDGFAFTDEYTYPFETFDFYAKGPRKNNFEHRRRRCAPAARSGGAPNPRRSERTSQGLGRSRDTTDGDAAAPECRSYSCAGPNPDFPVWASLSPVNWPSCHACPAVALCGGGCRYDAAMVSGRLDGLDPARCTQDREILGWAISDLARRTGSSQLSGLEAHVPTEEDRRALVGDLSLDPLTIPLGNANRYGERAGRDAEAP